jgi:uncharacterized membrane protein
MCSLGCFTIYIILTLVIIIPLLFAKMITGAFVILGFTPDQAFLLLILCLLGGLFNIPLKEWSKALPYTPTNYEFYPHSLQRFFITPGRKILAVNLGGAVIPGFVGLWEVFRIHTEFSSSHPGAAFSFWLVLFINTSICYMFARPVEGKGIVIPALIPPLVTSVLSLILASSIAPVIAFPAGVLGVLIGADLMHMKDIMDLKAPIVSIGGAGTFDGIFLCGILSVFLTV